MEQRQRGPRPDGHGVLRQRSVLEGCRASGERTSVWFLGELRSFGSLSTVSRPCPWSNGRLLRDAAEGTRRRLGVDGFASPCGSLRRVVWPEGAASAVSRTGVPAGSLVGGRLRERWVRAQESEQAQGSIGQCGRGNAFVQQRTLGGVTPLRSSEASARRSASALGEREAEQRREGQDIR